MWFSVHTKDKQIKKVHLFGEGGVWRDMVGTPVVGVLWLGN